MKKIYLFDSWSFGFKFFEYYLPYLKSAGYEVSMITMDSLQYECLDVEKSIELRNYRDEIKDKIELIDISEGDNIKKLGEEIAFPDIVLHLSLSHMENRLINAIFGRKKIKKIYVQHGNVFDVEGAKNTIKAQSVFKTIATKKLIHKLFKMYWLFREYHTVTGIYDTSKLAFEWVLGPRKFIWMPNKHKTLDLDLAYSFSRAESEALSKLYYIEPEKLKIIDNPEIYTLSKLIPNKKDKANKVVFIDQAFVETDVLSESSQLEDYLLCKKSCEDANLDFVIRPHPRTNISRLERIGIKYESTPLGELVSENNIYISYNSSLMKTFLNLGFFVIKLEGDGFRRESILLDEELDTYQLLYSQCSGANDLAKTLINYKSQFKLGEKKFSSPGRVLVEGI